MKHFSTFIFLLLIVLAGTSDAQTPGWLWAESQTGGSYYTQTQQLELGPNGTIYVSGRYSGSITLTGGLTSSVPGERVFSAKLDTSGNYKWIAPRSTATGYSYGFGIDKKGNNYSTGEQFIDAYDSSGNQKWSLNSLSTAGLSGMTGYDIKVDNSGNVYFTGQFAGTLTLGAKSLTSIGGSQDMFLAKLDSNGNCIWLKSAGGSGYDGGRELAFDGSGNIYVCGSYSNDGTFGSVVAPVVTSGFPSVFIAKYDTSGNALRVTTATNAGFGPGSQQWRWQVLAVDSSGNAYLGGDFQLTAQFGPNLSVTSVGSLDIFVAKCHFDGNWEWVKRAGGVAGEDQVIGITLDKADDIYAVGNVVGASQFDNISVLSNGNHSIAYVTKYANSTGDVQWVQTSDGVNSTGTANFEGVRVSSSGSVYVDGNEGNGTVIFGSYSVNDQANDGQNFLVTKLGTVPPRAILPQLNRYYCAGSTVDLPYTLIGTFDAGNTFTAELSDSTGNFITSVPIGSLSNTNSDGTISITIPGNTPFGTHYFIRIVSSSPATSSYASPNGNVVNGNYNSNFFITIGAGGTPVNVSPSNASVCAGTNVTLTATGGSSYTWTPATGLTCTDCYNPTARVQATTIYTVTGGACSVPFFDTVTVANSAIGGIITFVRDTICQNTPGNLGLAGSSGINLQWQSSADGVNFSNAGDTTLNYKTTPLQQTTWYRVTVGSGNCSAISDTQRLYVPPALTAYFNSTQTSAGVVAFNSDSSGGGIRSYHWDFGDNTTSAEQNPVHTFSKDTTYYVCLTLYDGSNCSYTFCRYTDVTDGVPTISAAGNWVVYPNPFNEQLTVSSKQTNSHIQSVEIYDVLGQLVINKSIGSSANTSLQLDVSLLTKGMYYVMIRTADANYVEKVVKQ